MNRKHAKSLLLAMNHKTMGEIVEFLAPGSTAETRTSLLRCVASLEAELQRQACAPTPIDSPVGPPEARCKQTLEMNL